MRRIGYKPSFIRRYKKLNQKLKNAVKAAVADFAKGSSDHKLKVHTLRGALKGYSSFSVNYSLRIIYREDKGTFTLLDIGTHDIYG